MHRGIVFLVCWICFLGISCRSDKLKKEAELKTREFFHTLKSEDEKGLARLYPGFSKFEQYYKSDSGRIVSTTEANGIITVAVDNRYTNKLGKLSDERICLFYRSDSLDRANLYDSKGLSDFKENDDFIFGSKTGCIDIGRDTTDQQILRKIIKAKRLIVDKAVSVYVELKTSVRVTSWGWESGFGGSASGHGIVRNSSTYSLPKLKYKVTYKDRFGSAITSDDGYVSYDAFEAGESKSFTFYTSYAGGATQASIELVFDDDMIIKYIIKKDWTGNECEEYFKSHPDTSKGL